jgi:hypothetical protein
MKIETFVPRMRPGRFARCFFAWQMAGSFQFCLLSLSLFVPTGEWSS